MYYQHYKGGGYIYMVHSQVLCLGANTKQKLLKWFVYLSMAYRHIYSQLLSCILTQFETKICKVETRMWSCGINNVHPIYGCTCENCVYLGETCHTYST